MDEIKLFLNSIKTNNNFYDWVLANGKLFTERDLEREKHLIKDGFNHKLKACYYNSQMALFELKDAKYYEGWYIATDIPIPLEHGFLVENEKVVDLTANGMKVKEYFGVSIPSKFVSEMILKYEMAQSILGLYWRK